MGEAGAQQEGCRQGTAAAPPLPSLADLPPPPLCASHVCSPRS